MNIRLANFLSYVLHPVLMPTYAMLLIFNQSTYFSNTVSPNAKKALFVIIILNTFLLPVIISYILVKRGWVKSLEMQQREERMVPFLSNLFLMLIASFMIYKLRLPRVFFLLTLGAAASIALAIIINIKSKISIHMIGIGGLIGTFFGLSTFLLVDLRIAIILFLLMAGLLGTARLTVGSHRPSQIYAGLVLGFLCEYFLLSI
jgi:hypothetical protein